MMILHIQKFIATRLHVAIRMRIQNGRSPIHTYYLCCRLKAMGYPQLIPVPFEQICTHAAIQYLLSGHVASDKPQTVVVAGVMPPLLQQVLSTAKLPIQTVATFDPELYSHATVLIPGSVLDSTIEPAVLATRNIWLIGAEDLLKKFS